MDSQVHASLYSVVDEESIFCDPRSPGRQVENILIGRKIGRCGDSVYRVEETVLSKLAFWYVPPVGKKFSARKCSELLQDVGRLAGPARFGSSAVEMETMATGKSNLRDAPDKKLKEAHTAVVEADKMMSERCTLEDSCGFS